jgi:hypothetical protein
MVEALNGLLHLVADCSSKGWGQYLCSLLIFLSLPSTGRGYSVLSQNPDVSSSTFMFTMFQSKLVCHALFPVAILKIGLEDLGLGSVIY